ncbi:hypothetical protein SERLA73DRAFT_142926 [Serpula lacrymans var. lacrymans S7.3]|uniref:Uncharacterized protein n=2 Tax=Serpula lacrymans var. lacrymans TaxID=341189 RepID=F8Q8M6_SERL3|nr:uncharacterized protein SERLADRAFT_399243 [Serpula lacrymans var. lacrymans S7.9]EGN95914.1 hypothetical protein SERLA73DRAFT_142926 [Serpula lacrymans var. lacrymans S7.3]EGO21428.1 hypothetical protein SERLADRAFT_399243 [Serpula lacrymans var. lacrymans S7.9]
MNPASADNVGPHLEFDLWLQKRSSNLKNHPTRYEASLYGHMTSLKICPFTKMTSGANGQIYKCSCRHLQVY